MTITRKVDAEALAIWAATPRKATNPPITRNNPGMLFTVRSRNPNGPNLKEKSPPNMLWTNRYAATNPNATINPTSMRKKIGVFIAASC
jgi:hypothetical protein